MLKILASLMVVAFIGLSVGMAQAVDMNKRNKESVSPGSSSQDPSMKDPRQVPAGEPKTISGKVTKINKKMDTIEIETAEGKKKSFAIDPKVKRDDLKNIQDGDNVTLEVADLDGARVATSVQKQS